MNDSRKSFILATISNYFSCSIDDLNIHTSKELNSFLDDGNVLVLAAKTELHDNVKLIQVYNRLEVEEIERCIILFKLRPVVITPENVHANIIVSSMVDTPAESLYHVLQKVYAPLLLKEGKWNKAVSYTHLTLPTIYSV